MELSLTDIGKYKIVKLDGKVDWEQARILDQKINEVVDSGFAHIVFNLEDVSFICSGGIGALVYNLNKVKKMGGAIYIISNNEYIDFIFETLKFDMIFEGYLFDSFEQFQEEVVEKE